jgi:predicted component of type VI protein secretion system
MIDKAFAAGSTVASRHAQLLRNDDGSFSITDLGAPGGTFVNDTRLEANTAAPLSSGDQVRVGSVRFVYRVP